MEIDENVIKDLLLKINKLETSNKEFGIVLKKISDILVKQEKENEKINCAIQIIAEELKIRNQLHIRMLARGFQMNL